MPNHAMNIINLKKGDSPEPPEPPPAYAPENAIALWGKPEKFNLYEGVFATEIVGTVITLILTYAQYSELPLW